VLLAALEAAAVVMPLELSEDELSLDRPGTSQSALILPSFSLLAAFTAVEMLEKRCVWSYCWSERCSELLV
jgi:hypothetical protein